MNITCFKKYCLAIKLLENRVLIGSGKSAANFV